MTRGVSDSYMKTSPDKSRVSSSRSNPTFPDYSFYEYHWDGPKRPRMPAICHSRQTTLCVVLEGESRHIFSTARILLYRSTEGSLRDARSNINVWGIRPLGPVIHSLRGQAQDPPPNASTLSKLTVALEVVVGQMAAQTAPFNTTTLVLRSPANIQELRRDSMHVLLEREVSLTCETLSLSLSFTHSVLLWTPVTVGLPKENHLATNPTFWDEHITTRIVRVLPPVSVRPRITLPTELLIKIFEDVEFRDSWRKDLLSFAQVCRAWLCAMGILHSRLSFSDDNQPRRGLNVYAVAKALSEKPLLGQTFCHFTTNNFGQPDGPRNVLAPASHQSTSRYTQALIAILRTTKNLRHLHLGWLDPWQADALFAVLHELRDVRTLSIGRVHIGGFRIHPQIDGEIRLLSVVQVARCMGRWPSLESLKLYHLHSRIIDIRRFTLRPPTCMLTQLTISRSHVSDKDFVHLFASSAKTLERVELDRIEGVTNAGLSAFLLSISQSVVYLTIRDVALPPFRRWGNLAIGRTERALDVAIDKMPRLRELRISGDVASELMLERRSKMFVAHNTSEETQEPIVRLWLRDVPSGFVADGKWPGWCMDWERRGMLDDTWFTYLTTL